MVEQSSYPAMLNIAQSVPSTESFPSNSRNSVQKLDPHTVGWTLNTTRCMWVRAGTNSGIEFRELGESGIGQNRTKFRELRNQTKLELIPGAEPVPQCSTLRNRMYSQILSLTWCRCSCWSTLTCCEWDTHCSSKGCQSRYEQYSTRNKHNYVSVW
jgi:hypothetical protein